MVMRMKSRSGWDGYSSGPSPVGSPEDTGTQAAAWILERIGECLRALEVLEGEQWFNEW